nr:uncharacterized protein LOC129163741 [Nothobranchius furzeri]
MNSNDDTLETRSVCSNISRASRRSSASAIAARARAKAEAARAQALFAQKEAEMMKAQAHIEEEQQKAVASAARKKAELQASLHTLRLESEAAAAIAEANVLEAAAENEVEELSQASQRNEFAEHKITELYPDSRLHEPTSKLICQIPIDNANTAENNIEEGKEKLQKGGNFDLPILQSSNLNENAAPYYPDTHRSRRTGFFEQEHQHGLNPFKDSCSHKIQSCNRNQFNSNYQPPQRQTGTVAGPSEPTSSSTTDLTKYLIRREMISSGLLRFDDQPENYWAWKQSFHSSTEDLNLTSREELDLLCKWLGPKSSEHARRIRAVHINDATAGVHMIWQRLEECYGSPEAIEDALLKKVDEFPRISSRENQKLRELGDILLELEAARADGFLPGLSYLDTSRGITPIVQKLPYSLHDKWVSLASRYKETNQISYPPFSFFAKFVCDQAKILNDPSFASLTGNSRSGRPEPSLKHNMKIPISVKKTEISTQLNSSHSKPSEKRMADPDQQCPLHNKPHPLRNCRGFRNEPLDERKTYLKENNICFKCCASTSHLAKDCSKNVQCRECKSENHPTALHPGAPPWITETSGSTRDQGGEQEEETPSAVISKCTEICGSTLRARSCSKICLVRLYPAGQMEKAVKAYVVLDEQSNKSLARSEFFELFGVTAGTAAYTLKTCSGVIETMGRRANNFVMESLDGRNQIPLPTLIECDMLPDDRSEIPTPEIAKHYTHLKRVMDKIPALDPSAGILILLGRDVPRAHKVREYCNGPHNAPYAQRLDLGWVIVGEVCVGRAHKPELVNVYRSNVLSNGRASLFEPCSNSLHIKEKLDTAIHHIHFPVANPSQDLLEEKGNIGEGVFHQTPHDDKPALSVEDKVFLEIMDKEVFMDDANNWVAPLPFKQPRRKLPNNRAQAVKRLSALLHMFKKRPDLKMHMITFMQGIFEAGHAEPVSSPTDGQECWYLPIFGVYHPRKPGRVRAVFDSSAKHEGVSLNDILLSGPDLNNTLLGVLTRFRKEPVAVAADIEQMFYCFKVRHDHRDFLRFLWFKDNDPTKNITEYRMTVHVFGNSPSPAVAIYGLRKAALQEQGENSTEAKQFVLKNFYVDDGLASFPTDAEAIQVLKETKEMLADSNIRLHKIASNHNKVVEEFPSEERAKELKDLELGVDPLPMQRSLGLNWNLQTDCFTFLVSQEEKPFTRRGILSTVNSIFDPIGFVAPVTIQGKAIVRELSIEHCEWDAPIPAKKATQWKSWRDSLKSLEQLHVPRPYLPMSLLSAPHRELCVFSDASTMAICAVAYLRVVDEDGHSLVGFCMGKSKVAPHHTTTVPRLELCAAVLAVELADTLIDELDTNIHAVKFYTDSRVVLGYINNSNRRFYVYVANRVARIRKSSQPGQWHFISSENNPADHGTRPVPANLLGETNWLSGPSILKNDKEVALTQTEPFELVEPDDDVDVRPLITTFSTMTSKTLLGSHRFERFSSWKTLVCGIAKLIQKIRSCATSSRRDTPKADEFIQARTVIIRAVQQEAFKEDIKSLSKGEIVSKHSPLWKLDPFLDSDDVLRIGGRAALATVSWEEKHPIIIPKNTHVATLLVRYYHERVAHQGRHFTEGAIRSAGLWILGGKRLISSTIHKCVSCRRLRGSMEKQKMSNLPADRLVQAPPFTQVGLDVFGPWTVSARRTRGGLFESKRWAVMFTCLVTRAVHMEVIDSLSTSSFINALRRFTAIRGPAKLFRSDRGTNFVGACKELGITSDDAALQSYLKDQGCTWDFNLPHSSHMGGAWERMIGIARRILDGMLLKMHSPTLSHEVLTTLIAEVVAIMNSRPIVPVSSDPDAPTVLTPSMLLTQKLDSASFPSGDLDLKDLYRSQWKQVQGLADSFWKRWRQEYLATLQPRRKWQAEQTNLQVGDLVLLKDKQAKRNEWPTGLIVNTFPGQDSKVRKVEVRVVKGGSPRVYLRPATEVVLLLRGT